MKIEITLHDECAKAVLRQVARRYALLCVNSTMPSDIANAPWTGRWDAAGGRKTWEAVYREWMAEVDRERAAYRRTLLSVLDELPGMDRVELKPYVSPGTKRTHAGVYPAQAAAAVAEAFAEKVLEAVAARRRSPRPD